MSRRIERINALLREEIAVVLAREIQDPRLGAMVSVTGVDTSPDLRNATVKVSILGNKEESQEAMEALRHAAGYLRREMATRLKLRQVPELSFRLDRSIEEGARILDLLREIDSKDGEIESKDGPE
jgi:ribosome-binding factor A